MYEYNDYHHRDELADDWSWIEFSDYYEHEDLTLLTNTADITTINAALIAAKELKIPIIVKPEAYTRSGQRLLNMQAIHCAADMDLTDFWARVHEIQKKGGK